MKICLEGNWNLTIQLSATRAKRSLSRKTSPESLITQNNDVWVFPFKFQKTGRFGESRNFRIKKVMERRSRQSLSQICKPVSFSFNNTGHRSVSWVLFSRYQKEEYMDGEQEDNNHKRDGIKDEEEKFWKTIGSCAIHLTTQLMLFFCRCFFLSQILIFVFQTPHTLWLLGVLSCSFLSRLVCLR